MYTKPNIKQMGLAVKLSGIDALEKEAAGATAAAVATGVGNMFEGAGSLAGSALEAGASTLNTIADLAKESVGYAAAGAVTTGLAAAYVAYKMKKPNAQDLDVDRSNLYKESLKAKIREIRRKQTIESRQQKEQMAQGPSLRLS